MPCRNSRVQVAAPALQRRHAVDVVVESMVAEAKTTATETEFFSPEESVAPIPEPSKQSKSIVFRSLHSPH